MAKVAFEAKSGFEGLSGTVSLPDGEAYDVGEALKNGGGKIVLDPDQKNPEKAQEDRRVAAALESFEGLKHTTVDSPKSSKESD